MEQCINHSVKRERMLTAIRIVEMIARKGLAPVLKCSYRYCR